jgi:RHS repeat-associated protein
VNSTDHPHGFGGKEENTELGLEWLDFGVRNYEASLGRWMNLDPLAEIMPSINPYHYCYNNPVNFIDPSGMFAYDSNVIASTFVDEDGNILDVKKDGDTSIYLVHDPNNWDGNKDGLVSIGNTATDISLKDFVGSNLYTEEVLSFISDELQKFNKDVKVLLSTSEIKDVAELKRNEDLVIRKLLEIGMITKKQKTLLKEMTLLQEMLLETTQIGAEGKLDRGEVVAKRILLRSIMSLYGNVTIELNDEWSGRIAPKSDERKIKSNTESKIKRIIKKYEKMIDQIKKK